MLEHWKEKYPDFLTGKIGKVKNFQLKLHSLCNLSQLI